MFIVSCSGTSKKSLGPLLTTSGIYTHGYDFRKSFLFHAEEFQIIQLLLMRWIVQAYYLLCAPSLICCSAHLCLSFTGEPSTGPSNQMCFSRAKERRRITSLHLLVEFCLRHPKILSALWHTAGFMRAYCWLMVNFLGVAPRTFLQTCLPISQIPVCLGIWDCSPPNESLCIMNFWRYFCIGVSSLTVAECQNNCLIYRTLLFPLCSAPATFFLIS